MKLLALAPGHRLHREQMMDRLWPDSGRKAASNSLRRTLHAARKILDPTMGARYLASEGESLVLCPGSDLWVDVDAFEETAATARRARDPATYRATLELYAGELLPGDRYEEWTEEKRAELRRLYLDLLVELAASYEVRGDFGRAVEALQVAVTNEPTFEKAHTGLMRLYSILHQEAEALLQYERLRETLSKELGTEPNIATRSLHEDIAAGRFPTARSREDKSPQEEPLASNKHNLPAPRNRLVGRERELIEIKRALTMTRLLTLTGVGGSGKTRLALDVARDLVGAYPDGVWMVELASLSEPDLVPQVVAQTLGVRESTGQPLTDILIDVLRPKNMLLLLDNCEHLVDATARLVDVLLSACPRLRILATSREALDVAGEVSWPVPPLSVPNPQRTYSAEELEGYESVRLFVERARQRNPAFVLGHENIQAVAQICRRLEGLPLAIELAAARIKVLSPRALLNRLSNHLQLLIGGQRDFSERQKTLRSTIEWSYEMLDEGERTLFARLAVFSGGWTLEAAEIIGAGDGIEEAEVLDLLSKLVDKSLIAPEISRDDMLRHRMLEPVRQYAQERLEESGEAQTVRHRHADFFLALAEHIEPDLQEEPQEVWFQRLEREHDNLRVALGWLCSQGEAELTLRLATALWRFWTTHDYLSEGRGWLERGIYANDATLSSTRAEALNGAGWIALFQGDHEAARALVEESLILYRGLEDKEGIASALANLGFIAVLDQQDLASVPALLEESIQLRPEVRNPRTVGYLLLFEALAAASQFVAEGSLAVYAARFRALLEQSMGMFREIGDVRGLDLSLTALALGELVLANYERATILLEEILHQSQKVDDRLATQYAFFGLAAVAASQGLLVRATRLWAVADAVRDISGIQLPALARLATDYQDRLATVRDELGEEAFEEAWQVGRVMTPEVATVYALSEEKPTTPESPAPVQSPPDAQATTLTHREMEVAMLVARGLTTDRQIANELFISKRTVETHVRNIFIKLRLDSRAQLAAWAAERMLLDQLG